MRLMKIALAASFLFVAAINAGAQTRTVNHFTKVTVSPYIQVTFVQGEREGVTIDGLLVDSSKLHVEVNNGTLRLYLDGAKDIPRQGHVRDQDGNKRNVQLYPNHAVIATVTYKSLEALSLRGEETQLCQSPITADEFDLHIYGESKVIFTEMHVGLMQTVMYGESKLEIKSGSVEEQEYTCYGEGKIDATAITGKTGKAVAFGEAEFRLNVTDRIKVTSFGEAKLRYMGNPQIVKGLHFGGIDLQRIN